MSLKKIISYIFLLVVLLINLTFAVNAFSLPVQQFIKNNKEIRLLIFKNKLNITLSPVQDLVVNDLNSSIDSTKLEKDKNYIIKLVNNRDSYWRIQILATLSEDKAVSIKNRLIDSGYSNVSIKKEKKLFKVQVGKFDLKNKAQPVIKNLEKEGWKTWLIPYKTTSSGQEIAICKTDGEVIYRGKALTFDGDVLLNDRHYPGNFQIFISDKRISIFNTTTLKNILYGVVSTELLEDDNKYLSALQAQAIASRSYVLYHYFNDDSGYLTIPVYKGLSRTNYLIRKAVNSTEGQVLKYKGSIIDAVYHKNSGGYTAKSENVWQKDLPYLQAVKEPFKFGEWTYQWTNTELRKMIDNYLQKKLGLNVNVNGIRDIEIARKSVSGRVTRIDIYIDYGIYSIENDKIRSFFIKSGRILPSTKFNLKKKFSDDYLTSLEITGTGEGHGVGMSQVGALFMAEQGSSYQEILNHYYTDVDLVDLTEGEEEEIAVDASVKWGLAYKEIRQLTWWGPRVITVLDLDLKMKGFTFKPFLANNRIPGLNDLAEVVSNRNVLAGVNGGFFSYTGRPLGLLMIDGQIVSEPIKHRTAVGITSDNNILIDQIKWFATLTDSEEKNKIRITGVNRRPGKNEVVIYNKFYGNKVPALKPGIKEVVIKHNRVQQINSFSNTDGQTVIPESGFVIQAHGQAVDNLNWIMSGKSVVYKDHFTPAWKEKGVISALGAGPRLISNGEINITGQGEEFQPDITRGRAPRTALGITEDDHLVLVTIDGRQPELSIGMSLRELAKFMLKYGVKEAMNLDGGGSARMVVRGYTMNNPSSKRLISNGLLINFAGN